MSLRKNVRRVGVDFQADSSYTFSRKDICVNIKNISTLCRCPILTS